MPPASLAERSAYSSPQPGEESLYHWNNAYGWQKSDDERGVYADAAAAPAGRRGAPCGKQSPTLRRLEQRFGGVARSDADAEEAEEESEMDDGVRRDMQAYINKLRIWSSASLVLVCCLFFFM